MLQTLKSDLDQERSRAVRPVAWPQLDMGKPARAAVSTAMDARAWSFGMILGLLLIFFAWFAIPPAVDLQWSVFGTSPKEFRVYRAEGPESASFELVQAITVNSPMTSYRFRDYQLLPGREYTYRIEAIGQNDESLADGLVIGDSSLVLPGQVALITAGLVSLYGLWVYLDRAGLLRIGHPNRRMA
jgi:hypothetical protein